MGKTNSRGEEEGRNLENRVNRERKRIEERGKVTEAIKKLRDGKTMGRDEILREV